MNLRQMAFGGMLTSAVIGAGIIVAGGMNALNKMDSPNEALAKAYKIEEQLNEVPQIKVPLRDLDEGYFRDILAKKRALLEEEALYQTPEIAKQRREHELQDKELASELQTSLYTGIGFLGLGFLLLAAAGAYRLVRSNREQPSTGYSHLKRHSRSS